MDSRTWLSALLSAADCATRGPVARAIRRPQPDPRFLPDRILAFVKDAKLSASAMKHFNRLKRSHTYKKFKPVEDVEREVPYAINSLVASALGSRLLPRLERLVEAG